MKLNELATVTGWNPMQMQTALSGADFIDVDLNKKQEGGL